MFQTGWVSVKREHRAWSGISALRLPAIVASANWTEWLPVTAFAIEHPEGLFLVDAGETAAILEPEYSACDAITGWFYCRNLRFSLSEDDELGPQMRRHGLPPERVNAVVLTHMHSDHIGGLRHFPNARVLVSERAKSGHAGALTCRLPRSADLRAVRYEDIGVRSFGQSKRVTKDGAIAIVPTPGHVAGHQSVFVEGEGVGACLVGDAAFSLDQILTGEIGGIVENVGDARRSAAALKLEVEAAGTVMLPTHDPGNGARLVGL